MKKSNSVQHFCQYLGTQTQNWETKTEGIDLAWVESAVGEGVAPLLYWHFQSMGWSVSIPSPVQEALTRTYYNTLAQNTVMLVELEKLLALFSQAGIPVVVLKGGALADGYYKDIGLRPMNDLDLLIPEPKISFALALIRGLGYEPAEAEIIPGIHRQISHNEYWRGGPGGRVGVELHWNLIAGHADDRTISVDWFWAQVEHLPGRNRVLHGRPIPQLNPTAHLLYLAAHLMLRHAGRNERLIWFYDVDRLIRSGRVDWTLLVQQAHELGWGVLVRYVLERVSANLRPPLPQGLVEQLAQEDAWQDFLAVHESAPLTRLGQTWEALRHLPWRLRIRLMVALMFPSPAYLRWRYHPNPDWSWPLYYLYRWGDVGNELSGVLFAGRKLE